MLDTLFTCQIKSAVKSNIHFKMDAIKDAVFHVIKMNTKVWGANWWL